MCQPALNRGVRAADTWAVESRHAARSVPGRTGRLLALAAAALAVLAGPAGGGALAAPLEATDAHGVRIAATAPAPSTSTSRSLAASYAFATSNAVGPAHWNRCTSINYWVNPAGMPSGALTDVHTAMGKLSAASGLHFTYRGGTAVVPLRSGWTSTLPSTARSDIFIAWSSAAVFPALAGTVAGLGGTATVVPAGREPRVVLGGVVLDRDAVLQAGFVNGVSRGTLLLHELGHAVNLAHVADTAQTMYPTISSASRPAYRTGDVAGLRVLAARACF